MLGLGRTRKRSRRWESRLRASVSSGRRRRVETSCDPPASPSSISCRSPLLLLRRRLSRRSILCARRVKRVGVDTALMRPSALQALCGAYDCGFRCSDRHDLAAGRRSMLRSSGFGTRRRESCGGWPIRPGSRVDQPHSPRHSFITGALDEGVPLCGVKAPSSRADQRSTRTIS